MTVVTSICLAMLVLSATLCIARVIRPGSSLADRIVALDSLLIVIVGGLAVYTARIDDGVFLGVLVVVSLLGFLGTITVARYIERRGA